jgi:dCMP deaminase
MGDPRSNFDYGEAPDVYTSIHAESDLVAQAAREGVSLRGASIYVTTFPCANCARLLARAEVAKVYYEKGYSRVDAEGVLRSAEIAIIQVKDA